MNHPDPMKNPDSLLGQQRDTSSIRSPFVDALIGQADLRRQHINTAAQMDAKGMMGMKLVEQIILRLLDATRKLVLSADVADAHACLAACETMMIMAGDPEQLFRINEIQRDYEQHLIECERRLKPLSAEELDAIQKFSRAVVAVEKEKWRKFCEDVEKERSARLAKQRGRTWNDNA